MNLYPMEYKSANGGDIASTKHNKKVYCNKGSFNNRKLSNKSVANKNFKLFKKLCTTIFSVSPMFGRRYKTFPQLLKRKSACTPNINKKDKANFNQDSYMDFPFKIFDQNILAKTATTILYITIK
ncbi:MAG: hypothetical protein ACTSYM_07450 [Candidatus Baldrarchaeia archaeon]